MSYQGVYTDTAALLTSVRMESGIPLLKARLRSLAKVELVSLVVVGGVFTEGQESLAVAFPDEGAFKRFGRDFKEFETIVCQKVGLFFPQDVLMSTSIGPGGR